MISRYIRLRMGNVSDKSVMKNTAHDLCSVTFFSEMAALVIKYGRARYTTDDNTALRTRHCMLDN